MTTPFPVERLQITVPGRPVPIDFESFVHSRGHVAAILQGETYPAIRELGPVRTILDIGANVGSAAVCLAARYPGAVVHAFEPATAPRELLTRNVASFPSVHVHPVGLHDHDATVPLFQSRWDPMSASIGRNYENTDVSESITVRQASAYLREIGVVAADILKIDTEGCEVPILHDLAALARQATVIHLEYHSDADRRAIDAWCAGSHLLFAASARHPHRGDLTYLRGDSAAAAVWAAVSIEPPV